MPGSPDNRNQPDPQVPGSPSPGSPDRRMSFSYVIPVLLALRLRSVLAPSVVEGLALFTGFLMVHTAAVLSSPTNFITGGGGQAGRSGGLEVSYEA